jgi:hypothetical protein
MIKKHKKFNLKKITNKLINLLIQIKKGKKDENKIIKQP